MGKIIIIGSRSLKLPAPMNGDRKFHRFMSSNYARNGLYAFAEFHAEILYELECMVNKVEILK